LNGTTYLLVIDYFSRYIEVRKLSNATSKGTIAALKEIFGTHGIPDVFLSDNGPQYSSIEFKQFASSYGFRHDTSSPYYPQGNREAERAVKTVKKLMSGSRDLNLALLSYRTTPLPWCGKSPTQLLMGRQACSNLPTPTEGLKPEWPDLELFRSQDSAYKNKLKKRFDKRHRARDLPQWDDNDPVLMSSGRDLEAVPGTVVQQANERSYIVETPTGVSRRNRAHLNMRLPVIPEPHIDPTVTLPPTAPRSPIVTRARTGTTINPPDRLNL